MHQTAHVERHFTASELVRDIVIGMADGLTVPFALAAGLSGTALATTAMVVTAGLAEIAAGSIAMGLGGYLAAKSDAEHYVSETAPRGSRDPQPPPRRARRGRRSLPRIRAGGGSHRADLASLRKQPSGLGRFHDAVRAGPGRARSQASPAQRR